MALYFDEMISSPARLSILAVLVPGRPVRFTEMKSKTGLTDGNLHVQTHKLADVGYLQINKSLHGRRSITEFRITSLGLEQLQLHVLKLKQILDQESEPVTGARPPKPVRRSDDSQVWS